MTGRRVLGVGWVVGSLSPRRRHGGRLGVPCNHSGGVYGTSPGVRNRGPFVEDLIDSQDPLVPPSSPPSHWTGHRTRSSEVPHPMSNGSFGTGDKRAWCIGVCSESFLTELRLWWTLLFSVTKRVGTRTNEAFRTATVHGTGVRPSPSSDLS